MKIGKTRNCVKTLRPAGVVRVSTQFLVFPISTRVDITVYQHGKCFIFLKCKSCDMFEDKCVWSALYPISNHSHIRQLQFATHAFSRQVLQQAVQISTCQWAGYHIPSNASTHFKYASLASCSDINGFVVKH